MGCWGSREDNSHVGTEWEEEKKEADWIGRVFLDASITWEKVRRSKRGV